MLFDHKNNSYYNYLDMLSVTQTPMGGFKF